MRSCSYIGSVSTKPPLIIYIYIFFFLAPDNGSQGLFNPIAMTVQKLVKHHRRERLAEEGERREVQEGFVE